MRLSDVQLTRLRKAVSAVCIEMACLQTRTLQWEDCQEEDLLAELTACILGSRVSYEVAHEALLRLRVRGFLSPTVYLCAPLEFEKLVASELASNEFPSMEPGKVRKYPFPGVRARHLSRTIELIYADGKSLKILLGQSTNGEQARRHLVKIAVGIGPKQASLFLRNVGFAYDLAILDSHVLRYMAWSGLVSAPPKAAQTIGQYEQMESILRLHAEEFRFPVGHVDVALWVVVRVARREKLL